MTWQALYASDLQAVYAVWVVPAAFLLYLLADFRRRPARVAIEPRATRFLRLYAVLFTLETMVDPFATGPLLRWLGIADRPAATVVLFFFVLLGDFRVLVLVLGMAAITTGQALRRAFGEAAAWTFIVPVTTFVVHRTLGALAGPLPSQALWLIYELGFLLLSLALRAWLVPARVAGPVCAYLRDVLAYVAIYYGLWATADVLILARGADEAWALRMIPNQLYYALYVPLVYALGLSRRYASASRSTHASR